MTLDIEDYLVFLWWWPTKVLNHPLWFTVHYILVWHFHTLMTLKCNAERYLTGQLDRETLNLSEEGIHINFSWLFLSPFSLLTGGRQTPQNPGKVEKVRCFYKESCTTSWGWSIRWWLYWFVCVSAFSTSTAVVGGLFAEWLWASGHSGGGLAGVAGGDTPSFCPVLCVGEAMWWLLRWRGPGVCSLAHTHTHHGGTDTQTHSKPQPASV